MAIAGIVILETTALLNGVDGALLSISLAALASIVGYNIKNLKFRR